MWKFPHGIDEEHHRDYLADFCHAFVESAKEAVDCRAPHKLIYNECNLLPLYDDVWSAVSTMLSLQHLDMCCDHVLDKIIDYIISSDSQEALIVVASTEEDRASIIAKTFVEVRLAKSLPSKPALRMSSARLQLQQVVGDNSVENVVIMPRICRSKAQLSSVLKSLHEQARYLVANLPEKAPDNLQHLVDALPPEIAVVLLLSGLEHLHLDDLTNSQISFQDLNVNLPANVKLVLTMDCEPPTAASCLMIEDSQNEQYLTYFQSKLQECDRSLTKQQWNKLQQVR